MVTVVMATKTPPACVAGGMRTGSQRLLYVGQYLRSRGAARLPAITSGHGAISTQKATTGTGRSFHKV